MSVAREIIGVSNVYNFVKIHSLPISKTLIQIKSLLISLQFGIQVTRNAVQKKKIESRHLKPIFGYAFNHCTGIN